jgi:nucleotide-binding universal stress UspA family protein
MRFPPDATRLALTIVGGLMYERIMVPVDLDHVERLGKALDAAADLAEHYGVPVCYVGVTVPTPTAVAHTPQEYAAKLARFGAEQAAKHGIEAETAAYTSHDPAVDLDRRLIEAANDTRSDLIVMASHVPGLPEHFFASNAGAVASHAHVSVFVIR